MKKWIYLISFFCLIPLSYSAQSLDDLLMEAAENNLSLKASYTEFEASMQQAAQVASLPDPKVSFGYFISPVETRVGPQRAKIGLSQMFPWFGTLKAADERSTYLAEAKYQDFVDEKNMLFLEVRKTYYSLWELHTSIGFLKDDLILLSSRKDLANTSFSIGRGSMADVIRADMKIDELITKLELTDSRIPVVEDLMYALLSRTERTSIQVVEAYDASLLKESLFIDSMIQNNPNLLAMDRRIKAASSAQELAKKNGSPSIGLGLDYVLVDERDVSGLQNNGRDVIMPMLSLSLPIFRGVYKAGIEEARLKMEGLEFRQDDMTERLKAKATSLAYEQERNFKMIELYNSQIEKSIQVRDLLLKAYGNTGADFEDILDIEKQLVDLELARVNAIAKGLSAKAEILFIIGEKN